MFFTVLERSVLWQKQSVTRGNVIFALLNLTFMPPKFTFREGFLKILRSSRISSDVPNPCPSRVLEMKNRFYTGMGCKSGCLISSILIVNIYCGAYGTNGVFNQY